MNVREQGLRAAGWVFWSPRRLAGTLGAVGLVLGLALLMGGRAVVATSHASDAARSDSGDVLPVSTLPPGTGLGPDGGLGVEDDAAALAGRFATLYLNRPAANRDLWQQQAVAMVGVSLAETVAQAAKLPPSTGRATGPARQVRTDGVSTVYAVPTTAGPFEVTVELSGDGYTITGMKPPA